MLGAPGSGKGTQAMRIAQKYGFAHISTGDLFRKEIASQNALGKEAQSYIEKGQLCPDSLTINMLHDFLSQIPQNNGCIFDGVPRTIQQAEMLAGVDFPKPIPIDLVINLNVDPDEIKSRLLERANIQGRSDDTPEIIEKRLDTYFALTQPLEDYYSSQNKLAQVAGMGTVDEIFHRICQVIDEKRK